MRSWLSRTGVVPEEADTVLVSIVHNVLRVIVAIGDAVVEILAHPFRLVAKRGAEQAVDLAKGQRLWLREQLLLLTDPLNLLLNVHLGLEQVGHGLVRDGASTAGADNNREFAEVLAILVHYLQANIVAAVGSFLIVDRQLEVSQVLRELRTDAFQV